MAAKHLIRGILIAGGGFALWTAFQQSALAATPQAALPWQTAAPQPAPRPGLISTLARGTSFLDRLGLFDRLGVQDEFDEFGFGQVADTLAPGPAPQGGFFEGLFDFTSSLGLGDFGAQGGGDVDTVARTIWGEARGEGRGGMEAVAAVIMNRAGDPRWPSSPAKVSTQRLQFSAWNTGDPNRAPMLNVDASDRQFAQALDIAQAAISGTLRDPTGGSTNYHASWIAPPIWTDGAQVSYRSGAHIFYTGVA